MSAKKVTPITESPIIKYWDYMHNTVDPATVASKSGKKFWWICPECGESHEKVAINQHKSPLCRKCGHRKAIANGNKTKLTLSHSIAEDPKLSKYWDYENNVENPKCIAYKSNRKFMWHCSECNKSFKRTANNENKSTLCKECAYQKSKANVYVARLKKTHTIAEDSVLSKCWDYKGNIDDPSKVTYKSTSKFYWICPNCGVSFERSAYHMNEGQLCKECTQKKSIENFRKTYLQTAKTIADDPIQSKYWDYQAYLHSSVDRVIQRCSIAYT